jgi:apolipoprotein N-acyltransferase
MLLSLLIFYTYREKGTPVEVLIIHPSTDNKDVKYQKNIYELMDIYLEIMKPHLTENTEYVVLPETAITNAGWMKDLNNNLVFDHFNEQTVEYPNLKLVSGAIVYEAIPDVEKIKGYRRMPGIRYSEKYQTWYYTYNSAVQLEKGAPVQMRVKEGLVPYQEYAPYPRILPRLAPVGIDFQFSSREPNRQVFTAQNRKKTAALICYELVFDRMFFKAVREGAEAFFVLLNEGWYLDAKHVPEQFLQLSEIRAIENRRCVAHASNMGISAFIDQRGNVTDKNESERPGYLKHEIKLNKKLTFAALMGDFIGKVAFLATILLIAREIILKIVNKKYKENCHG